MVPVRFVGADTVCVAPGCGDLPALFCEVDEKPAVISCWQPSEEELAILNAGGCVCLSVVGGQPPVCLWAQKVKILE